MSKQFLVCGYVTLDDDQCDGTEPSFDAYVMIRNMHVGDMDDVEIQRADD